MTMAIMLTEMDVVGTVLWKKAGHAGEAVRQRAMSALGNNNLQLN